MLLPKAILLDLDDTIISFDGVSEKVWTIICDSFVTEHKTDFNSPLLRKTIFEKRKWFWSDPERNKAGRANLAAARRQVVQLALDELSFHDEAKANGMADKYTKVHEESLCLFEGVVEALDKIKSLDIRMAVVTNGAPDDQWKKINRFNLGQFFEFVLIGAEVGFSKPETRIYEIALEKLALQPDEVWMVGDNLVWDIEAPQKLGIYSVWNDYGAKGLPTDSTIIPDKIVSSLFELSKELDANGH